MKRQLLLSAQSAGMNRCRRRGAERRRGALIARRPMLPMPRRYALPPPATTMMPSRSAAPLNASGATRCTAFARARNTPREPRRRSPQAQTPMLFAAAEISSAIQFAATLRDAGHAQRAGSVYAVSPPQHSGRPEMETATPERSGQTRTVQTQPGCSKHWRD